MTCKMFGNIPDNIAFKDIDDVVQPLLKKKASIIEQLRELDTCMAELEREYTGRLGDASKRKKPLEDALTHIDALLRLEGWQDDDKVKPTVDSQSALGLKSFIDAAYDLLAEVGKPVHYREMAAMLGQRQVYIPGKNPAATLLSKMTRDTRFKRAMNRGMYALASWRVRRSRKRRRPRKKQR